MRVESNPGGWWRLTWPESRVELELVANGAAIEFTLTEEENPIELVLTYPELRGIAAAAADLLGCELTPR